MWSLPYRGLWFNGEKGRIPPKSTDTKIYKNGEKDINKQKHTQKRRISERWTIGKLVEKEKVWPTR